MHTKVHIYIYIYIERYIYIYIYLYIHTYNLIVVLRNEVISLSFRCFFLVCSERPTFFEKLATICWGSTRSKFSRATSRGWSCLDTNEQCPVKFDPVLQTKRVTNLSSLYRLFFRDLLHYQSLGTLEI